MIGTWTMPYKHPRGTQPVQVVAIGPSVQGVPDAIVTLSDGSTMHVSRVRAVNAPIDTRSEHCENTEDSHDAR